ncbi:hypothetical protein [Alkalicoccus urumqiensis]|uniref:Uncharacterized protein n=1 Tax=Alkalicoccus urumqiensis TaxID=1548213 RepID=A0A2P6MJI9_ALKUR|nr:hypothetical protein [Alkalicoccus urumqiensis]PRO66446.1 hypothetical protein C6I21_03650 [Alkalicoccus urumqiensis]
MSQFTAEKKVTREEFMELAQSGMRELFDAGPYKVVDGTKGSELHHFVYNTQTHDCYLIDLRTSYELLAMFYAGGDKEGVENALNNIATSAE